MDITLNLKNGDSKTHKDAKFEAFGHHWITFTPRSGPMKGEKISVNLKAYSVQQSTENGPRVTESIESITLGKNTARGDCRSFGCPAIATHTALQAEVQRLQAAQAPSPQSVTDALRKMRQIVQLIQDDPEGPHTSQADDLAGLLDAIERALPRRNGGDA